MEQRSWTPVVPAFGAALVAAVVGGVVWALVVRSTDYEVGIVAWAIGWLAGTAAVTAGRGARGPSLQGAAVVAALVGILLGKYLSYAWVVQDAAHDVGVSVGLFSSELRSLFRDDLRNVFGWLDIAFVGFAVYTAWRITARPPRPPAPQPRGAVE